ncbi:hypothetical protein T484DRAFT_1826726, partial [Baffinella frigidus]
APLSLETPAAEEKASKQPKKPAAMQEKASKQPKKPAAMQMPVVKISKGDVTAAWLPPKDAYPAMPVVKISKGGVTAAWLPPKDALVNARVTGHADAEARRSVVTALRVPPTRRRH